MNTIDEIANTLDLQELEEKARELQATRDKRAELEAQVDAMKAIERQLEEVDIPEILGTTEEITVNGLKITRSTVYRSSVTKANQMNAFSYLTESGNQDIIKQLVTVDLKANPAIIKILNDQGISFEEKYDVHWATLNKVINGLVKESKLSTEDFETFSIYAQPKIKIKSK